MLSYDLRSLETKAVQVDGSIGPDDPIWQEGDKVVLSAATKERGTPVITNAALTIKE
jgi:hypothetical protein